MVATDAATMVANMIVVGKPGATTAVVMRVAVTLFLEVLVWVVVEWVVMATMGIQGAAKTAQEVLAAGMAVLTVAMMGAAAGKMAAAMVVLPVAMMGAAAG